MKIIYQIISGIGLALTIIPSILVFAGQLDFQTNKTLILVGTFLWFLSAPFWVGEKPEG